MSQHTINIAAHLVGAASTGGAGTLWLLGQGPAVMPPTVAENAGVATVLGILSSLVVLIVNGWLSDRKSRRESEAADRRDARMFEVKKLESNERIAALENQVAGLQTDARIELALRDREKTDRAAAKATADDAGTRRDVAIEALQAKMPRRRDDQIGPGLVGDSRIDDSPIVSGEFLSPPGI